MTTKRNLNRALVNAIAKSKAKPFVPVKDRLITYLRDIGHPVSGVENPDNGNTGALLFDIFVWQEALAFVKERYKRAWQNVVEANILPSDNKLRYGDVGGVETIASTKCFVLTVQVGAAPSKEDKDKFMDNVSLRYKIPLKELESMWEEATTRGTPRLFKRVVEA
jgi:hypothetical protein